MHTHTEENVRDKRITFFHLKRRINGVAQDKGGYTVAIRPRNGDLFSVSICQCNANQRYDEALGQKTAAVRLNRGQFFVQSKGELETTLTTLHHKLSEGTPVRLDLSALN